MQYYINLSSANSLKEYYARKSSGVQKRVVATGLGSTNSDTTSRQGERHRSTKKSVKFNTDSELSLSLNRSRIEVDKSNNMTDLTSGDAAEKRHSITNACDRPLDLILFAASGCVGKFLVEEMALVVDKYYNNQASQTATINSNYARQQQQPHQNQFAQQVLRKTSVPSSSSDGIKWAVAGRSAVKLSETLCRAELSTGIKNLSRSIPIILADLNHQKSLLEMCEKTKLIINCAGPYSELGAEDLIKSCIDSKTNYIDLAHEVTFIETIRQKYSDKAKQAEVFVLNGCGFQSMSAEMGLNFTKQVADGTIEQVKIILSLSDTNALVKAPSKRFLTTGIVSEGMWNSLIAEKTLEVPIEDRLRAQVHQITNEARQSDTTERQVSPSTDPSSSNSKPAPATEASGTSSTKTSLARRILERKDTQSLVRDLVQYRNRSVSLAWPLRLIQGFQGRSGRGYCWPIDNMSSDEAQLIRGEMNNYELRKPDLDSDEGWRPIRCSTFLSVKNFTQMSFLFVWLFVFHILVKFSLFRLIMRRCPRIVTLGHVLTSLSGHQQQVSNSQSIERDSISHIKFCQTFIAYGLPSDESGDPLERRDKHSARKQVRLLVSRVVGPEPNHIATATFAIQAAMTLLTERDHLPCAGGVLTPGAAFSETNIIYQLRRRNIKFEVLKKA